MNYLFNIARHAYLLTIASWLKFVCTLLEQSWEKYEVPRSKLVSIFHVSPAQRLMVPCWCLQARASASASASASAVP